jgi:hypothetical protein
MIFSDVSNNTGILQQVRDILRVDANQWSTAKVVNSCNNYLDTVAGYAIGADRRFQWDDTNHTKLPIGTTNLVANQSDYSFLTDEQGNKILNLIRIDILDSDGIYRKLQPMDEVQIENEALDEWQKTAGKSIFYDKIADNIVRLYPKPDTSVTAGLKFYFQRTPSYFVATDTTKEPGVPALLHRGFVISSAYDGAFTLDLPNTKMLAIELEKEKQKMIEYFENRLTDEKLIMRTKYRNPR